MGKKLTERRISYRQYRLADLMVFLLIMCVCEALNIFALQRWFPGMMFTISVMLLVTLIALIRWNWFGLLFPIAGGLFYCWMNGAAGWQYAVYSLGNAFIALIWFVFLAVKKEKITSHWWLTTVYAVIGFVLVLLGRSLIALFFGYDFGGYFMATFRSEALNLVFAVIGLLILRNINGMLVDQKQYLVKVAKERDEVKHADEYRWNGYTELNEDDLRDLVEMDEYNSAINFNRRSLRALKEKDGHDEADDEEGSKPSD